MTHNWEAPQVVRTGYVDDDNCMYEVVPAADNENYSYWVEELTVSITEAAEGGEVGIVRFKFSDGEDWFEFDGHSKGLFPFEFGNDGYEICAKGAGGLQMICANALDKQAKAWVMFRGHKRLQ